ncbi:MAG: hypothetical protein ABSE63_00425 [Thermoguttaceae bacterium]|jgi:hypothetical protein
MNHPADSSSGETSKDSRKISKWSRIYAQNRSLGVALNMLLFLMLCAAIGVPACLGSLAYIKGYWVLLVISIVLEVAAFIALIYFSVPRWGGKLMERITERVYAREGIARLEPPHTHSRCNLMRFAGVIFAGCVIASVALDGLGFIPHKYMQPVSAIYVVPFLVMLVLSKHSIIRGPIVFLWPGLYALHAILILAGVPILFSGRWDALNMLIPTVGYGLLVSLISHVYSRFALWKLRRIAGGSFQNEVEEEQEP